VPATLRAHVTVALGREVASPTVHALAREVAAPCSRASSTGPRLARRGGRGALGAGGSRNRPPPMSGKRPRFSPHRRARHRSSVSTRSATSCRPGPLHASVRPGCATTASSRPSRGRRTARCSPPAARTRRSASGIPSPARSASGSWGTSERFAASPLPPTAGRSLPAARTKWSCSGT
jgi:hypothetical protein